MDPIESRLHDLGYHFQTIRRARPFLPVKITGDLAFLSGHGPADENGQLVAVGQVGGAVSIEQGYEAARRTAVNCLGTLKEALGSLERVEEVIKVLAFVNSAPGFYRQPEVANGFTDLLKEVLGDSGAHARSAVGTSSLPNNQPIEVEMIARIRP